MEDVDWKENEVAIKSTLIHKEHWLTKQVLGISGVKKMMNIWGKRKMDECPRGREKETMAHVMACKDKKTVEQFCDLVENLDLWMMKADKNQTFGQLYYWPGNKTGVIALS